MGKISKAIGGGLALFKLKKATAVEPRVLAGDTFYAGDNIEKTGSMPNNTGWSGSVGPGETITVPEGYHDGNTKVRGNSVKSGSWKGYLEGGKDIDIGSGKTVLGVTGISGDGIIGISTWGHTISTRVEHSIYTTIYYTYI